MRGKNYNEMILEKIRSMPQGAVFSLTDFADVASRKTVSKILGRLADDNVIQKLLNGVFWTPSDDASLPHPNELAEAIAKSNLWSLAPSGDTALFNFGEEVKKPTVWTYVTNGTYRSYVFGNITIKFLHSKENLLNGLSKDSALIVQVLRAYGRESITKDRLRRIIGKIPHGDMEKIREEFKDRCDWVSKKIRAGLLMDYWDKRE